MSSRYLPKRNLTIQVSAAPSPAPALKAQFKPAPEKPALGEPGKSAGEVVLGKDGSGQPVALVSLGKPGKITLDTFRQAGGGLARWLRQSGVNDAEIDLAEFQNQGIDGALAALCEGLCLASFQFNRYKSKPEAVAPITVSLVAVQDTAQYEDLVARLQIVTDAVNLARDWQHEPPNSINPITLAERAADLAQEFGLKCTILDDRQLSEMKAGGIVDVGKGSATPSRLIVLEYAGVDAPPGTKPVALIGKALTFDTGGYSLKTVEGIVGMKYDKSGGVAVLAAVCAAAQLKLKTPVVAIVGAAENRIAPWSYLPDDIVTTLSGKTVEIISTDAEGRMVLADCLTYAQQVYKPAAMVDLATLTGGVVVALGRVRAGLLANNAELAQQLIESGDRTYERLWQLPLDDEYVNQIKSDDADLKNSGGREASSIIGGTFLRQFVEDEFPWAHLDIAGVADTPKDLPYCPKGGTGFGVRLLLDYLQHLG
jgi:leucyl aminopeptidase